MNQLKCKEVRHHSAEYEHTVALRYEILRKPLGLMFDPEELNKENDYSFLFSVKGETEIELQSGNLYYDAYTLEIENDGNIFNLIDLSVQTAPKGWVVQFTNKSVPLDIIGKYSKVEVGVDITVPANTVASNEIKVLAASVNAQEKTNTLTLKILLFLQ